MNKSNKTRISIAEIIRLIGIVFLGIMVIGYFLFDLFYEKGTQNVWMIFLAVLDVWFIIHLIIDWRKRRMKNLPTEE